MKKVFLLLLKESMVPGKATQTELLKEKLEKLGYKILIGDFPAITLPNGGN